tara:strand:+ start:101 stop:2461 length:2361 start_codon:yes stop_codon:yes gene_type:complete
MVDFTATPGDTVLGKIRETYGRLPQVEINRLLEEFERINQRPAGNILANEVYVLPKSTYYRDQVGERFGADELLDSISTAAAYRNKALGRVNSWRELAGLGPATFTPSTLASSLRSYSTATDKDIENRIVAEALASGIGRMKDLDVWFTQRGYDKVFLKATADALRARLGAERSEELQAGKVAKQFQEVEAGNTRVIIRDGNQVPQVRTKESNWEWIEDPGRQAYPRYQPTALQTYKDLNGRLRYKEGPNIGRLVSDVEGLPMVEKEDPHIIEDKNGRKRYVATQELVFPNVKVDPTTKTDVNGRLRFTSGPNEGDLVFTAGGEAIAKEYAGKDPEITTDANGRKRFVENRELVFPTLDVDPTTQTDVNGRLRYVGGPKDKQFVFGGAEGVPKEFAPKDPLTKTDENGKLRYVGGKKDGDPVFPTVVADPKTHTDLNGRLRYTEGPNEGDLVFGEIAKEYAPKEPSTKKAADGFLYYETGPDIGKRVFPNVKVEPKTHTDVNGRLRYSEGENKGKFVFDTEIPKEYKPTEDTTAQRDFEYWLRLRKEGGHEDTAASKAALWQKFRETKQVGAYSQADVTALSKKKVSFLNTANLTSRMLTQLSNPKVLIGGVASLLQGFENITGQFEQIASTAGEMELLDQGLYHWGRADLSGALKSNITALAYSLARAAEESGGRLSDRDVQAQIDRISNGLQSKSSMASALVEVHNTGVRQMANFYQEARDRGILGTDREWDQFLLEAGTGILLVRENPNNPLEHGMGYFVTITLADGTKKRPFRTIARWTTNQ